METLRKAMKIPLSFVLGLLLFLYPFAVHAVDMADAPASTPMSEDALNYLLSEDMYQGTLSWQSNKASTKFNYDKPMKKRQESTASYDGT